ncbi:MAG: PEGA domain-containing protein [Kofleriaceae bacterium]|nr:PEGA domain-containing protein [Kofleriaceae bacterium]
MKTFSILLLALATTVASAEDRKAAEKYFRQGAKAYAAQSFAAAAANFDEAYKAAPMPEIAFSAAQAYRRLYRVDPNPAHVRRAIELYKAYLAVVKKGGRVGDAADSLEQLEQQLRALGAAASASSSAAVARTRIGVSITLADQSASEIDALREVGDATGEATRGLTLTIDGQPVEPFALVQVEPKEHVIVASAEGYLPVEKKTIAVDGASSLVEIVLQPKPAKVTVKTEAGARISVDGRAIATTPTAPLELAAGNHLIAVLRSGREPFAREITVARGETLAFTAPLAKTAKRRAVPWVLGGAGLLAAGAVATGITANLHDGRALDLRDGIEAGNRPPSDADQYDDEVRKRDRFVTSTWVLGGAAVAAGTVGVLLLVFDTPSAEGVRLAPTVGAGSGGATLIGTF